MRDSDPDHILLLGPRLKLFRAPATLLAGLEEDPENEAYVLLEQAGFLSPAPSHVVQEAPPPGQHDAYLVTCEYRAEALLLAEALAAEGSRYLWGWLPHVADRRDGGNAIFAFLNAVEPCDPLSGLAVSLLADTVLWFGEGTDGVHAGPVFVSPGDVERYVEATRGWAFARELAARGFDQVWPLSLVQYIRSTPRAVARAMVAVERRSPGVCCLVEDGRLVAPWTALRGVRTPIEQLVREQRWSKGLLRNLSLDEIPDVPGVFLGKCQTPALAVAALEGNGGKGLTREDAEVSTIGEAVERFAACEANREVAVGVPDAAQGPTRHALADFHPFGAAWEDARDGSSAALRQVVDVITGGAALVPACLIPFPHVPGGARRMTTSDTAGLATYPTREGAVLRGALELLERHNFYPGFLHQRQGRLLNCAQPGDPEAAQGARLVDDLARARVRTWILVYEDELCGEGGAIPIVHAFLLDAASGTMSRGSGSGCSLGAATTRALLEALQIRAQHRLDASTLPLAYANWRRPEVVDALVTYLDRQDRHTTSRPAPLGEPALLDRVRRALARRGLPLLIADLPCPVDGWTAIRALVPGLTTNQYPSRSAGGDRLAGCIFTHGIPT